jgi:hypothetical protein
VAHLAPPLTERRDGQRRRPRVVSFHRNVGSTIDQHRKNFHTRRYEFVKGVVMKSIAEAKHRKSSSSNRTCELMRSHSGRASGSCINRLPHGYPHDAPSALGGAVIQLMKVG